MHKIIAISVAAMLSVAVPHAIAADNANDASRNHSTAANATGAASNQAPGAETSDRTPEKTTPTPETQVDKTKSGETSDRTPKKH